MLILSRRREESIIIGDDIRIKVLAVKGERVHLGIDAPPYIDVYREEIYDMIRNENIRASKLSLKNIRPKRRRTG